MNGTERRARRSTILNVGGMNDDAQQQAQRIDEDMALAPLTFLPAS
jgi:hypothetical protein